VGIRRPELRLASAPLPRCWKPVWGACNLCIGNWADTVRRNGASPGLSAAPSLSGLQSSGGHAFALLGAGRAGAGFGRSSGGCGGLAVRATDRYIGWSGAERAAACPGLAITVVFSFCPGCGCLIWPVIYWWISPAAGGGLAGPARLGTGAFGNLCGNGRFKAWLIRRPIGSRWD